MDFGLKELSASVPVTVSGTIDKSILAQEYAGATFINPKTRQKEYLIAGLTVKQLFDAGYPNIGALGNLHSMHQQHGIDLVRFDTQEDVLGFLLSQQMIMALDRYDVGDLDWGIYLIKDPLGDVPSSGELQLLTYQGRPVQMILDKAIPFFEEVVEKGLTPALDQYLESVIRSEKLLQKKGIESVDIAKKYANTLELEMEQHAREWAGIESSIDIGAKVTCVDAADFGYVAGDVKELPLESGVVAEDLDVGSDSSATETVLNEEEDVSVGDDSEHRELSVEEDLNVEEDIDEEVELSTDVDDLVESPSFDLEPTIVSEDTLDGDASHYELAVNDLPLDITGGTSDEKEAAPDVTIPLIEKGTNMSTLPTHKQSVVSAEGVVPIDQLIAKYMPQLNGRVDEAYYQNVRVLKDQLSLLTVSDSVLDGMADDIKQRLLSVVNKDRETIVRQYFEDVGACAEKTTELLMYESENDLPEELTSLYQKQIIEPAEAFARKEIAKSKQKAQEMEQQFDADYDAWWAEVSKDPKKYYESEYRQLKVVEPLERLKEDSKAAIHDYRVKLESDFKENLLTDMLPSKVSRDLEYIQKTLATSSNSAAQLLQMQINSAVIEANMRRMMEDMSRDLKRELEDTKRELADVRNSQATVAEPSYEQPMPSSAYDEPVDGAPIVDFGAEMPTLDATDTGKVQPVATETVVDSNYVESSQEAPNQLEMPVFDDPQAQEVPADASLGMTSLFDASAIEGTLPTSTGNASSSGLFSEPAPTSGSLFGGTSDTPATGNLFNEPAPPVGSLFNEATAAPAAPAANSLFASEVPADVQVPSASAGLFANTPEEAPAKKSLFGSLKK